MDDFKGHLDGVGRLYQQIDQKISEKGGLGNLFGLHAKIRESLELINPSELDFLLNEIQRAKETLSRLEREVLEIRLLKEAFDLAESRVTATMVTTSSVHRDR